MQMVFCDTDARLWKFFTASRLPKGAKATFFAESVQDLSDEQISKAKGAEILSLFTYSRAPAEVLKRFPKLKLICQRSTGYNAIDLDYCKKHKIKVANVAGYGEITVAEFAVGLLLDLVRKIGSSFYKIKHGIVDVAGDTGRDINGKTVGVIGTGAIGAHFARLIHAFGTKVLAYDPFPNPKLEKDGVLKYVALDEIYKKSDFISLHAPATDKNYQMINEKTIAKMKKGVYIINTARGQLIDTVALYNALKSGHVAGAGLDVLDHENIMIKNDISLLPRKKADTIFYSLVNKMLVQLPNVVITPHIAFNSEEAEQRILLGTAANLAGFVKTGEPKYPVKF